MKAPPKQLLVFDRKFAMPSKHTFTIKPIKELLAEEVGLNNIGWADPFAGWNSPAFYTNDLNPDAPTTYHMKAEEFATVAPDELEGVLFDPPYSPRQISENYKGIGLSVGMKETQSGALYKRVKDAFAPKIKTGGKVICCGWNSMGFGINRGFQIERILLVPHGGGHYDTIVTVERKIQADFLEQ